MSVKTIIGPFRSPWMAVLLLLGAAAFPRLRAQDTSSPLGPATQPALQIELSAIGYRQPSRMDRLSEDEPSVSLDFVDADHLLLVFDRKKLFQRLPECPPEHRDRLMHAVILELPSGKVVKQADWYLHDRRRYLWPLGQGPFSPGDFLLRKGNDLYLLDASLHEKLLLHSPKALLWVSVTPDASEIVTETAIAPDATNDSSPRPATAPAGPRFVAQFLDAKTLAPRRTLTLNEIVKVTGTSAGYADLVHKDDIWLLRFGPTPAQRRNIARVRSRTVPSVLYSSDHSLLIGRCPSPNCDYSVTAFAVTGRRLWQQHWTRYRSSPAIARSADNSRVAVSTLRLAVDPAAAAHLALDDPDDPFQPEISQGNAFQQEVQVLETASGNALLSVAVNPAAMAGQNFTLSSDGRHLAVLRGSGLGLFNLPPASREEQIKFSALKSDVPDLYTVESMPDNSPPADGAAESDAADAASSVADDSANSSAEKENEPGPTPEAADTSPDAPAAVANNTASASFAATATESKTEVTTSEPATTFKVAAKAVVVDVVVTDSKGHPVKGLRQQDFHLAEDGNAQDISYFRESGDAEAPSVETPSQPIAAGRFVSGTAPALAPSPAKLSANVFSNHARSGQPGAGTMILFDTLNTPSQDQASARQQLIKFLQSKPKDSQFALCTLGGGASPLRLIQGFTVDDTVLLAAAKGGKGSPKVVRWKASASGTENSVGIVGILAQGGRSSGFQNLLSALQGMQDEQRVTDTDARVGITTDAMMSLARYLSGIPGRKNLVWLSGSFPMSVLAAYHSGAPALDNPNYAYKIKRLTNLLAEAQVAVYPVDVRGLAGDGSGADSAGTMGGPPPIQDSVGAGRLILSPSASIPQAMQVAGQQEAERATLMEFATATGGTAFLNTNGISEAIATANEQGSDYYTLSYSPTNKRFDGKLRKIKVGLAETGCRLHYRQDYFADGTHSAAKEAEMARLTRATAMQYGSPPSRQLQFSANVVPVGSKQKMDPAKIGEVLLASTQQPSLPAQVEVQRYSVDYSFRGAELHFVPLKNQNYRNTLILMVASFDREGRMLTGISDLAASELEPEVYKTVITGELAGRQELDVPVEAVFMRLGIQDQMSSHLGTIDIPLPVPPPPAARRRRKNPLPAIEPD
jgi:VWFA-related protein